MSGKTSYNLDGKSINDEEFTLKRITDIKVQKNQKFRIWDGEDLVDKWEFNNHGKHCVLVDFIYDK